MQKSERNKLIELTERALTINEELLADEKKFIKAVSSGEDLSSIKELNEKLNQLCRKEHMYLAATKSLIKTIQKK
jgi:hypothetical protein